MSAIQGVSQQVLVCFPRLELRCNDESLGSVLDVLGEHLVFANRLWARTDHIGSGGDSRALGFMVGMLALKV